MSACALGSTATEDCMAFDSTVGQAALRFSWESCCPEGAVIGKLPAAGACVSLAYTFTDGVDAVEVGSYSNVTGNMIWTEVPAAVVAEGFKVCGRSCRGHVRKRWQPVCMLFCVVHGAELLVRRCSSWLVL